MSNTYELLIRIALVVQDGRSNPFPAKDSCSLVVYWFIVERDKHISNRTSTPLKSCKASLFFESSKVWNKEGKKKTLKQIK